MTSQDTKAKGPGQGGRGRGEGFSFGDKEGGRGRGRDGRGGRDRRGACSSASFRVGTELGTVEKALTKQDFAGMKAPLGEILRALKPLHLKSIEDLDFSTRGKLITTLMRVVRAPKPKPSEGTGEGATEAAGEAPAEAPAEVTSEGGGAEASAPEAPAADAAPEAMPVEAASEAPEAAPAEAVAAPQAAPAPAAAPMDAATEAWREVLFTIGLIWRAVADVDRAATAFEAAGRQPTEADLAAPPARAERPERGDRPARGPRGERGERGDRGPRGERGPRPERRERKEAHAPFVSSGDWQADAQKLEELGRTRDAGRIHEKHQSYAAAARLYELGGDLKAALRNAVLGKVDEAFQALSAKVKPEDVVDALQRAQAWDKLMEFHVARGDFDAIARLYERALQFDQAGLAWERAGKLALARKAYERAKDQSGAARVRDLEVQKLVERGDRLGAATLLVGAGKKDEALAVLKALPAPKAFHFMEKLKLADDAKAFAQAELAKAEAANNPVQKARWLELTGELKAAAETYLSADRKDRAAFVFEQLGDLAQAAQLLEAAGLLDKAQALFEKQGDAANAERVKALPRPEPKPKAARADSPQAEDDADAAPSMPPPEGADTPGPGAPGASA